MKSISIPPAAREDEASVEMARVWVAKRGRHCVLNVGTYRDSGIREATAGDVILSDRARHTSHALRGNALKGDSDGALSEIQAVMIQALAPPLIARNRRVRVDPAAADLIFRRSRR